MEGGLEGFQGSMCAAPSWRLLPATVIGVEVVYEGLGGRKTLSPSWAREAAEGKLWS